MLENSADGGASWQEQPLTRTLAAADGTVAFAPDGTLYQAGLVSFLGVFLHRGVPDRALGAADVTLLSGSGVDKPWLSIDGRTGTAYVAYTGPTAGGHDGILLWRSADSGSTSSETTVVAGPVLSDASGKQVETGPFGAQTLIGTGGALAVTWIESAQPGVLTGDLGVSVRVASSTDDGRTFSAPKTVGQGWGYIAAAAQDGIYYIVSRRGQEQDQRLTVATSRDAGRTWATAPIGDGRRLYFDHSPAPGVGVAPDGTIDVAYYTAERQCLDPTVLARALQQRQPWTVPCTYDVYYTYSKDGAKTWAAPKRLNASPIAGKDFVRIQGDSRPGEYIGVASTDHAAFPIWIDGTRADTVRVER